MLSSYHTDDSGLFRFDQLATGRMIVGRQAIGNCLALGCTCSSDSVFLTDLDLEISAYWAWYREEGLVEEDVSLS